jgi:hypothetical protein
MATLSTDGWATVSRVVDPARFVAENRAGERFVVWHLGVIGPTENQGDWFRQSTEEQARRLPVGTRVWIQSEGNVPPPADGWVVRHVLRDADPNRLVGADLLRAGSVWVYPHARHSHAELYANRQAEAVATRTGSWGETQSSEVFRPRGAAFGGYPVTPRLVPALRALDASELGHALLLQVNTFPVELGVSQLPRGAIGAFQPRYYSIQLNANVMSAAPESIAGVLLHELIHARQMIDGVLSGAEIECYAGEVEAFEATARYWTALHGPEGKRRPTSSLDNELNSTLRQFQNDQIMQRVARSYGHECGAG